VPRIPPPAGYRGVPCSHLLPAGTQLYRVHRRWRATTEFNPTVASTLFGGGRFDPVAGDEYPYLYLSLSAQAALAEVLLRNLPFNNRGTRILPQATIRERQLASLELTTSLTLITLSTSSQLAAIGQDEWLIHADTQDYPQTRGWGRWLREQAPWAHGLIWPSKRDLGEKAVLLFGDRCPPDSLKPGSEPPVGLDDTPGCIWLNEQLAGFKVTVRMPARRARSPRSPDGSASQAR
jgi:hypothetical protein